SGVIGVIAMTLNTNMLYIQTTAMFEPLLMAMATAAVYYLTKWGHGNSLNHLLLGSLFTMLATLTRYDGWALFMAGAAYVLLLGL
ncbi:hypothetical protein NL329_30415, partial [Klebsiella pneumoniae]|nr:hypothetical protein [Klebsiella pneumoniae]